MGRDDRWPAEIRPFRWKELEELRPKPPMEAGADFPPTAVSPNPPEPDPASLLEAAREEAARQLLDARAKAQEIRETARREGYEAGVAEGRAVLETAAARWEAAAEELAGHKPQLMEEARTQVVDLALALVDKILGPLAEGDAEAVTRVTARALAALSDREMLTIRVHPEDLQSLVDAKPQLLRTLDGIKKLTVVEDHSVTRGGCMVETPTAEIDARLDTQLQELARALKKTQ